MRKLFSVAFVLLVVISQGFAQTDARAKKILAEVSKKYKSYNFIKTDFAFTLENPQAKLKETQKGTLFLKGNSNKYKVAMTNQELYSDGKSQWTFLKKDNEVQINNVDNSDNALNPAKIFTIYEKGFKYTFTGESKLAGRTYQNIDLSPIDTKKSIFKVRLSIDKLTKQIATAVLFDKNGSKYTYAVKKFVSNSTLPEATFAFDAKKYPGVEIVDLR